MDADIIATLLGQWQRKGCPHLFIGIAGGSAAGKTTFAEKLAEELAPLRVEIVHQDRFFKATDELPPYKSSSTSRTWPDYNHPDSIKIADLLAYCGTLNNIDVALVEGILVLHYEKLRALMDIKCYVDADADERIVRRIRRNLPRYRRHRRLLPRLRPSPARALQRAYKTIRRPDHPRRQRRHPSTRHPTQYPLRQYPSPTPPPQSLVFFFIYFSNCSTVIIPLPRHNEQRGKRNSVSSAGALSGSGSHPVPLHSGHFFLLRSINHPL
jgi:uridine kinase